MQFGAANFPVRPVLEEIDALGALQMDYFELSMDPPMAHHSLIGEQKHAIQKSLKRWSMGLVCHLPTFVYMAHLTESIRRASVQEVLQALETASDLGARKAVVHPGYIDGLAVHVADHALALAMEGLEKVSARARQLGVVLCVENLFPRLGPYNEPDHFTSIFEAIPDLKFVLDTGHANIGDKSGRRVIAFIQRFADRLDHLHLSDNNGANDEHLPLGQGNINFKAVARALQDIGYDDTVTLEVFSKDRSELVKSRSKFSKLFQK